MFHTEPTREYREHEHDILDIAWSPAVRQSGGSHHVQKHDLLVSCSFDQKIIVWSLTNEHAMEVIETNDVVTCVSFHPEVLAR